MPGKSFPGWKYEVGDQWMAVDRADYLFRAVQLSEGAHQVVFTFDPISYRMGKNISIGTLLFIFLLSIWKLFYLALGRSSRATSV